ncbi:MAG: FMN-binding protein [Clostridiales bacterium]|nr:FMN-binding protein [Clostridiales bacterium]
MKDKGWFNIVFMFICTAFFTGILSGAYVFTRPQIQANARLNEIRAQLNALQIELPAGMSSIALEAFYDQNIKEVKKDDVTLFQYETEEGAVQNLLIFEGAALWGDIVGVIALDEDFKTVIGMDIIKQNETPGLGGRIAEDWFKEQFRGIKLYEDGEPLRYASPGKEGQLDAVTGATATSNALLSVINESIKELRAKTGGGN